MSTYLPTIKQLQYLVALHEHGHFGRAAEAMLRLAIDALGRASASSNRCSA